MIQYYEHFRSIADTEYSVGTELVIGKGVKDFATRSSSTETAAEIYGGISFLMGGDRDYYWKML